MGFGTSWRLGSDSDARLIYHGHSPGRRFAIDVKFITSLELQILRCKLQGLPAFDPKIEVYDLAFPKPTDPEFEEWYKSVCEGGFGGIDGVLPGFLDELRGVKASQVKQLGTEWGLATDTWWHTKWPDHAAWALGEFIRAAKEAKKRKKLVFAWQYM